MADDPGFRTTGYSSKTFTGTGRPHAHTKKGREFAQRLVESESYRKWLYDAIENRTLDPSLQRMLWAYAYGKPKEYIELSTAQHELSDTDTEMLRQRVERMGQLLSQLSAATTRAEADRLIAALEQEKSPEPTIQ